MSIGTWIAIISFAVMLVTQLITIGVFIGGLSAFKTFVSFRLDVLDKKQDKHNGLIERMVTVEQSAKSAHHRLDSLTPRRKSAR